MVFTSLSPCCPPVLSLFPVSPVPPFHLHFGENVLNMHCNQEVGALVIKSSKDPRYAINT